MSIKGVHVIQFNPPFNPSSMSILILLKFFFDTLKDHQLIDPPTSIIIIKAGFSFG